MRGYLTTQVPFGNARTAGYLMFAIADAADLMERGRWHEAQAVLSLTLVGGEQAALLGWQWPLGRLLAGLAEPPGARVRRQPAPEDGRSLARLGEPGHIGAAVSFMREMAAVSDAQRRTYPGRGGGGGEGAEGEKEPGGKASGKR